MTIVTVLEGGCALLVADARKREALEACSRSLTPAQFEAIEVVALDMRGAFIVSVSECVPDVEHKALGSEGDDSMKGSRRLWRTNPDNLDEAGAGALNALHRIVLKTSKARAPEATAMCLWPFVQRAAAVEDEPRPQPAGRPGRLGRIGRS